MNSFKTLGVNTNRTSILNSTPITFYQLLKLSLLHLTKYFRKNTYTLDTEANSDTGTIRSIYYNANIIRGISLSEDDLRATEPSESEQSYYFGSSSIPPFRNTIGQRRVNTTMISRKKKVSTNKAWKLLKQKIPLFTIILTKIPLRHEYPLCGDSQPQWDPGWFLHVWVNKTGS